MRDICFRNLRWDKNLHIISRYQNQYILALSFTMWGSLCREGPWLSSVEGSFLKKKLSLHPPSLSLHPSLPPPLLNYSFANPQRPSRLPPLHVLTETGVLDSNTAADFKRHHITKQSRVWEKRPVAPRFSIPHHFFYSLGFTPLWSRPRFAWTSETRHQTVDAQLHPAELEIRGGVIIHCSKQV